MYKATVLSYVKEKETTAPAPPTVRELEEKSRSKISQ